MNCKTVCCLTTARLQKPKAAKRQQGCICRDSRLPQSGFREGEGEKYSLIRCEWWEACVQQREGLKQSRKHLIDSVSPDSCTSRCCSGNYPAHTMSCVINFIPSMTRGMYILTVTTVKISKGHPSPTTTTSTEMTESPSLQSS